MSRPPQSSPPPSSTTQVFRDVPADHTVLITEGEDEPVLNHNRQSVTAEAYFTPGGQGSSFGIVIRHLASAGKCSHLGS
jgi:hypothetical protein